MLDELIAAVDALREDFTEANWLAAWAVVARAEQVDIDVAVRAADLLVNALKHLRKRLAMAPGGLTVEPIAPRLTFTLMTLSLAKYVIESRGLWQSK